MTTDVYCAYNPITTASSLTSPAQYLLHRTNTTVNFDLCETELHQAVKALVATTISLFRITSTVNCSSCFIRRLSLCSDRSATSAPSLFNQFNRKLHSTTRTQSLSQTMSASDTGCEANLSLEDIHKEICKYDVDSNGCLDLKLDNQTGIATLCINNPSRKNAFTGAMMFQFNQIVKQLEQWDKGRVVFLYGADEFFCSGVDLNIVQRMPEQSGAKLISAAMHDTMKRFQRLPIVSVALVEGMALGGGVEIITCCDLRVFTASTRIGFVHGRLGVTPAFGGGIRLVSLVGPSQALQLMLSAQLIDVEAALKLGLVNFVLDQRHKREAALEATIDWYMTNYGQIGINASQSIKKIVSTYWDNSLIDDAWRSEAKIFCNIWGSPDHKKALDSKIKHK